MGKEMEKDSIGEERVLEEVKYPATNLDDSIPEEEVEQEKEHPQDQDQEESQDQKPLVQVQAEAQAHMQMQMQMHEEELMRAQMHHQQQHYHQQQLGNTNLAYHHYHAAQHLRSQMSPHMQKRGNMGMGMGMGMGMNMGMMPMGMNMNMNMPMGMHPMGMSMGVNNGGINSSDSSDDIQGKIFIGGLSWQTKEANLRSYFEKYGELEDVAVMTDKETGKTRGFGFIKMKNASDIDSVMLVEHTIDGRLVDVKRALPRDKAPGPTRSEACKVFVGGLAADINEKNFGEYFSKFGVVKDAVIMVDRNTGRSRGFGFITFENEQVVDTVIKEVCQLEGKTIEIKRAEPRDVRGSIMNNSNGDDESRGRKNNSKGNNSRREKNRYSNYNHSTNFQHQEQQRNGQESTKPNSTDKAQELENSEHEKLQHKNPQTQQKYHRQGHHQSNYGAYSDFGTHNGYDPVIMNMNGQIPYGYTSQGMMVGGLNGFYPNEMHRDAEYMSESQYPYQAGEDMYGQSAGPNGNGLNYRNFQPHMVFPPQVHPVQQVVNAKAEYEAA